MSDPILGTKIHVPAPRDRLVHRLRLIDRLNESVPRGLTLVSAPAGFGKTTLVSDWAARSESPIAWISLEEADSDPRRFLVYLVSALQTIDANLGESLLGLLRLPEPPPQEWALSDLINDIAQFEQAFTLVLDDYHLVDSKPADAALTFLLEHMPPQMRVVMTAREDPQLPLARYRSRGRLAEVREADLRFTPEEATEFLDQVMGLDLAPEDVAALESRTEGWIVGLQLAALSMQGLPDPAGFVQSFSGSHRFVLDYLVEEVLHRQPRVVQDFLLGTSILETLCGPLCDAVLPEAETPGQDTLEFLERHNLFVIPLDHERRWYRYHHLFAGLLRDRLARTQPDRLTDLHRRASDWFARNGGPVEAVTHALAVQDWPRAANVIERSSDEWPMLAGVGTTLGWLESFPAGIRLDRPELGLVYAWSLFMDDQLDRAERFLAQLAPLVQSEAHYLGEVFAIRVMIAAIGQDMPAVIALAEEGLSLVSPEAASPRSRILLSLGVAHTERGGDLGIAKDAFREAGELGHVVSPPSSVGNAPLPVTALAYMAECDWLQGNLREASRQYDQARDMAYGWGGRPSIALSLVQQGRAALLYEWDDLEGAALALEESIRIGESWSNPRLLAPSLSLSATVAQSLGRIDDARMAIARAERLVRDAPNSPLIRVSLAVPQLALGNAERDWEILERWQEFFDRDSASGTARTRGALAIALVGGWIARHRHESDGAALRRAASLLEPALVEGEQGGLGLQTTRLHILESLVLYEQGEGDASLRSLEHAVEAASPEKYIRSFVDLGEPMASLLHRSLESQKLSEPATRYVRRLLSHFRPGVPVDRDSFRAGPLIEPLSRREMEVLRLIAAGLSNAEIGERLFLALSTIKGHTRIIFDKLQVHRRTEAVARARELGLL